MQVTATAVCNMGVFGDGIRQFWMGDLIAFQDVFGDQAKSFSQDFYALLVLEASSGELLIDQDHITLDRHMAIIIKPSCLFSLRTSSILKGKLICFSEDFFALRYNNNVLNNFYFLRRDVLPFVVLNELQRANFEPLLDLMTNEFSRKQRETKKVLRSYLNILLFEIDRLFKPGSALRQLTSKQRKIFEFETLIEKHYHAVKLPSFYAEKLNVSSNYLNKICKEETGATSGEIIRKRLNVEAQRLLFYTSLSVKEIADKLGFENVSYFITFFKKLNGQTPEQFRKNQGENE